MTRKSSSSVARREIAGPILCCLFVGLLASPACAGETPADTACQVAMDAVRSALSPTGGDKRAVVSAAWRACGGTNVDPRLTARAALMLLYPSTERAKTLETLQSVYERLVTAGVHGRELIQVNDAIGSCQLDLGQREAALATLLRSWEMRKEEFGETSLPAVIGMQSVAAVIAATDPERGLALAWETLTRLERERGEADPATLRALSGLSLLYQNLGRFDEALRLSERHHEIWLTLPEEARVRQDTW